MRIKLLWKIALLASLPFLFQLLGSCCECPETDYLTYYNCEIFAENLDNSGIHPERPLRDSITANAYAIGLFLNKSDAVCEIKSNSFPLGLSGAYAVSCDCPPELVYEVENEITTIRIISLVNFSSEYPAGSDLTSKFRFFDGLDYCDISIASLDLNRALVNVPDQSESWDLLLMETPEFRGQSFSFRVEMERLDGTVLKAETAEIVLQ